MEIEQLPPKRPNFLLILLLSGVAILAIFGITLLYLHSGYRHRPIDGTRGDHAASLAAPVPQRSLPV